MQVSTLTRLPTFVFWLACAAEQPSCDSVARAAHGPSDISSTRSTHHDSVSLLQSRPTVQYGDDASPSPKIPSMSTAIAEDMKATALVLTRNILVQHLGSFWSTLLVLFLAIGACWVTYVAVSFAKLRVKEDRLETRVTDVLKPQSTSEDCLQPPEDVLPHPRVISRPSPFVSPISPSFRQSSPTAVEADTAMSQDIPPLDVSQAPLTNEMRLLVAKDAMLAATRGGEFALVAPNAAPLMCASVRKVDGDFWLNVSMHAQGSSPSAVIRLTNKDAPAGISSVGAETTGPEVYGPDGGFYGTVQLSSVGARLISSTTAMPVLSIAGDMRRLQLSVRAKSGLELATVCLSSGEIIDIRVHSGADLALVIASVLTVILSSQR